MNIDPATQPPPQPAAEENDCKTFTCRDCGWQWLQGQNGNHDCKARLLVRLDRVTRAKEAAEAELATLRPSSVDAGERIECATCCGVGFVYDISGLIEKVCPKCNGRRWLSKTPVDAVSPETLAGMDAAMKNFEKGIVSPPLATAGVSDGERPNVVCLCGSSKYPEHHMRTMMAETLAGSIVIPMGLYGHADFPEGARTATNDGDEATEVKQMLDRLHFAKIDMADEILVVNVGGYFGSSTRREIAYAAAQGKRVRYLEHDAAMTAPANQPESKV